MTGSFGLPEVGIAGGALDAAISAAFGGSGAGLGGSKAAAGFGATVATSAAFGGSGAGLGGSTEAAGFGATVATSAAFGGSGAGLGGCDAEADARRVVSFGIGSGNTVGLPAGAACGGRALARRAGRGFEPMRGGVADANFGTCGTVVLTAGEGPGAGAFTNATATAAFARRCARRFIPRSRPPRTNTSDACTTADSAKLPANRDRSPKERRVLMTDT